MSKLGFDVIKMNVNIKSLEVGFLIGLGIGCNFMIDNQLQPTD